MQPVGIGHPERVTDQEHPAGRVERIGVRPHGELQLLDLAVGRHPRDEPVGITVHAFAVEIGDEVHVLIRVVPHGLRAGQVGDGGHTVGGIQHRSGRRGIGGRGGLPRFRCAGHGEGDERDDWQKVVTHGTAPVSECNAGWAGAWGTATRQGGGPIVDQDDDVPCLARAHSTSAWAAASRPVGSTPNRSRNRLRHERELIGSGFRSFRSPARNALRSNGRVYMISEPSSARGHSSRGRSRYNSTPLPSGSRR